MDDPAFLWPAWKFWLKQKDLFTTLHEEYNTSPSAIQDSVVFHHDIVDNSRQAKDLEPFKHILHQRRAFRLNELNEALDYTAQ